MESVDGPACCADVGGEISAATRKAGILEVGYGSGFWVAIGFAVF